jgi:hypothetical protein
LLDPDAAVRATVRATSTVGGKREKREKEEEETEAKKKAKKKFDAQSLSALSGFVSGYAKRHVEAGQRNTLSLSQGGGGVPRVRSRASIVAAETEAALAAAEEEIANDSFKETLRFAYR